MCPDYGSCVIVVFRHSSESVQAWQLVINSNDQSFSPDLPAL